MPSTSVFAHPYASPGDTPDVPYWLQQLAESIEAKHLGHNKAAAKRMSWGTYSGTTDATGHLTITHSLGWTPGAILSCSLVPDTSFAQFWGFDTATTTQVRLRFSACGATAGTFNSTATGNQVFFFFEA